MPLLWYLQVLFLSPVLPCSFYCLYCLSWDSSSGQGLPHSSDLCNALPSVAPVLLGCSRQWRIHVHPNAIKLLSSPLQIQVSYWQWTLSPGGAVKWAVCALWLLGRSLSFLLPDRNRVRCSFSGSSDGHPFTTQQSNQIPKSSAVAELLEAAAGEHVVALSTNWSGLCDAGRKGTDLVGCVEVPGPSQSRSLAWVFLQPPGGRQRGEQPARGA